MRRGAAEGRRRAARIACCIAMSRWTAQADSRRLNLLVPLRHRNFRLLWAGHDRLPARRRHLPRRPRLAGLRAVELPAALSVVGIGMTVPTVVFLLPAGVISDRFDRRLGHARRRCAPAGRRSPCWRSSRSRMRCGSGSSSPSSPSTGSAPRSSRPRSRRWCRRCCPPTDLAAANSLDQFVRPIAGRLAGPARRRRPRRRSRRRLGVCDRCRVLRRLAASRCSSLPAPGRAAAAGGASSVEALKEGLGFVRQRVWLWGTLALRSRRVSALHGPDRGLAAVPRQEHPACVGPRSRAGLRSRRHRRRLRRRDDGASAAIPAAT